MKICGSPHQVLSVSYCLCLLLPFHTYPGVIVVVTTSAINGNHFNHDYNYHKNSFYYYYCHLNCRQHQTSKALPSKGLICIGPSQTLDTRKRVQISIKTTILLEQKKMKPFFYSSLLHFKRRLHVRLASHQRNMEHRPSGTTICTEAICFTARAWQPRSITLVHDSFP